MRHAMFLAAVAPQWGPLHFDALTIVGQHITVDLSSPRRTARCPDCQRRARRAHSRFVRVLADVPLGEMSVCVHPHARIESDIDTVGKFRKPAPVGRIASGAWSQSGSH